MKLRNKNTGVIGHIEYDLRTIEPQTGEYLLSVRYKDNSGIICYKDYKTFKEFNEEWEDYKDPKEFWYIVQDGDIFSDNDTVTEDYANRLQEIGNYFESIVEAKKALGKLKAWKRLKDKGFRFRAWYGGSKNIDWEITSIENEAYIPRQICDDLDLLFGGE